MKPDKFYYSKKYGLRVKCPFGVMRQLIQLKQDEDAEGLIDDDRCPEQWCGIKWCWFHGFYWSWLNRKFNINVAHGEWYFPEEF